MRTRVTSLALALSLLSPLAMAQTVGFDDYDVDNDGLLSEQEFMGSASDFGAFDTWDNDSDGLLSDDEWGSIGLNEDFGTWDDDDDGFLNEDEYYSGTFDTFDENENGHWEDGEWDDAGDAGLIDV
jgi:hypothetical protein